MRARFIAAALVAMLALPLAAQAQFITAPDGSTIPQTGAAPNVIILGASTNCSSIKTTPGILFKIAGSAGSASTANFVRLFDIATTPSASVNTPVMIIQMPAFGTPLPNTIASVGEAFANGIGICVTGTATATSQTSAVSGGVVNYSYK